MKIQNILSFSLTAVFAGAFATYSSVHAQTQPKSTDLENKGGVVTQVKSSQRVYVNPNTGKLEAVRSADQSAVAETENVNSVNRSLNLSGVASAPQLLPDGSRKIEFNGQFMAPLRAKINSDGDVEVGHDVGGDHDHSQDK